MIHNFRELIVWQKSMALSMEIYTQTKSFPREELFGIVSQMRRAATSIPANIAEGAGRATDTELTRFLSIAEGSAFELETWLIMCGNIGYIDKERVDILINNIQEIQRMLAGLRLKYSSTKKV